MCRWYNKNSNQKKLDILEYLFHCKGGELAAHFYEFYIPPNTIKRFVEPRKPTGGSFLGYITYSHNELLFLQHSIPIHVGDSCSVLDQNIVMKADIAIACTVCPRDFTNADLNYISNHLTLQKWLLISFRVREIYRSGASWTPANVKFMEQLGLIEEETARAA